MCTSKRAEENDVVTNKGNKSATRGMSYARTMRREERWCRRRTIQFDNESGVLFVKGRRTRRTTQVRLSENLNAAYKNSSSE